MYEKHTLLAATANAATSSTASLVATGAAVVCVCVCAPAGLVSRSSRDNSSIDAGNRLAHFPDRAGSAAAYDPNHR